MPESIPFEVAQKVAEEQGCRQVIMALWDGKKSHVVTFGVSPSDSDQAAQGGNLIKTALGWPAKLCEDVSPKVKALQDELDGAKGSLHMLRMGIDEVTDKDMSWAEYIVGLLNLLATAGLELAQTNPESPILGKIDAAIDRRPRAIKDAEA